MVSTFDIVSTGDSVPAWANVAPLPPYHCMSSLNGGYIRLYKGLCRGELEGLFQGDTRSLDYSSHDSDMGGCQN